jgi:hypothetical protein
MVEQRNLVHVRGRRQLLTRKSHQSTRIASRLSVMKLERRMRHFAGEEHAAVRKVQVAR